jgi:adenine-specific DNA-methyltransferase
MPRNKANKSIPVETLRHKDKRKNIPTEELRDFVAEDEKKPKTMLYPRDPSLDPQLVWKGKDEQDAKDLAVAVVPVYIQEKIHPQALIEDFRRTAREGQPGQADLFSDFNGLPEDFDKRVDFYHYEGNWQNRMMLGDSLLVMTSLAEKEGLKGKVQMIYIDPPYGINFGSNWQVSTRKRDVKDGKAEDMTRQPEQIRAFRDTWKLGIHSYLAYLRDRLTVARELLTESGSVFVQMGDENVHLVRCVMDEVFGSENFQRIIPFKKSGAQSTELLPSNFDFLLWYVRNAEGLKFRKLYLSKEETGAIIGQDIWVEKSDGALRKLGESESPEPGDRLVQHRQVTSPGATSGGSYALRIGDREFYPPAGRHWSMPEESMKVLLRLGRLFVIGNSVRAKEYLDDFPVSPLGNVWADTSRSGFGEPLRYVVETSTKVLERCLLMTTDPGDLVLDPTCGSGTTAYVGEQWGRRWITIDTSRVALTLARTRLMAAKFPYYLLADSPEGAQKEMEITGQMVGAGLVPAQGRPPGAPLQDIKKGFVYKRVPHVTLKSIANNPDIKEGMTREQIDPAIARHASTELLYDQPYEDSKRIRVTGPFTVESLSPYRLLSTDEERPASEAEARRESSDGQFATMIIDNLKKAGVQNTFKNERLKFDRLESFAGTWIHASGEYTEKDGKVRRAAVSIGPEHGTVGPDQVKEAAKEAVQGVGFDLLVVCGFAFDPHVSEEAKRYGKLMVMPTRMNYDLTMGDDLLKRTGAGNLFMYFGEPDIEVKQQKDGKLVVKIKGLDIYDPTTGQIRSHSTDDIACWFIDANYNGESFFVRHAYFTGAEEPYDKLKRALRAEIDEAAWSALYSTVSRPFDPPKTGKIAVKVINHYGDEVLKVYPTSKT